MELRAYPLLHRPSQLAMVRTRWRWGKSYDYKPRGQVLRRLSKALSMSESEVRDQIAKERQYLLRNPHLRNV